ncbi:MAG: hypothetical protein HKN17_08860 [Rhodothermales bacterium]|nr:hypothetical protein [Rhodothermales bacterium]
MQHRFGLLIFTVFALLPVAAAGQTESYPDTMPADSTTRVIYLVRHAEKCEGQGSNPGLTEAGRERARLLAHMLTDAPISAVYTTPYHRTRDTAQPVAEAHGLDPVEVDARSQFNGDLARELRASDHPASIVVGHSNTIPPLVNSLAGSDYPTHSEAVYDRLYIVTLPADGSPHAIMLRYGVEFATEAGC